ncbi:hypothetical protein [Hymenobacter chitinivorans]|uniref:DUF4468 domain-containing protein n=1 Tax=Hymenobacter chitinivorans DSM 11115 TaxID=1121954 RepID=A0A2M9B5N4_9BACT|nr:hypothetical protein [Hymenobacter chitinivorans]PJJ53261.1 hypothetical protein CLV45_3921 [Hymenobacter chitinivorans DSM 11115]
MKKLYLLLLLLVLASAATAQKYHFKGLRNFPYDSTTRKVKYVEVIDAPGISRADLYRRARQWLTAKNGPLGLGTLIAVPEEGQLRGRLALPGASQPFRAFFLFEVLEGQLRCSLTDFTASMDGMRLEELAAKGSRRLDEWLEQNDARFRESFCSSLRQSVADVAPSE